jgi:2-(1,2-epoxy-1,2-dihydrophenyl)acetyl-CoA isomerase
MVNVKGESPITIEQKESTLLITMNRPERLNALTDEMRVILRDTLRTTRDNASVRAVVLTGAGRAFCSGADLSKPRAEATSDVPVDRPPPRYKWLTYFHELPVPVIAAVNGPAVGAGFGLALACDQRVMGKSAFFFPAFSERGLAADNGVSWMLPRLVGPAQSMRWLWNADRIGSEESLKYGLADSIVDDGDVLAEALALAAKWANGPTVAYGLIKEQVYGALVGTYENQLITEELHLAKTRASLDATEGVAAFREKRAPKFVGR